MSRRTYRREIIIPCGNAMAACREWRGVKAKREAGAGHPMAGAVADLIAYGANEQSPVTAQATRPRSFPSRQASLIE